MERDLCGPSENGKDAIFLAKDSSWCYRLYAVQTKKGKLNCSRKISKTL